MNPFQDQALQYLASGLGYPIPSAYPFEKFPPLVGWTGKQGNIPSRTQVAEWGETHPMSNILLRLASNVIGIDVDDYDNKHGGTTMHNVSKAHGLLPDSPFSSARGRAQSGIRYYLLDATQNERNLKGDLGTDSHVEVIRYSHRYAVVPPSWHQGAEQRYEWHWDGMPASSTMPYVSDLNHLPASWYEHLTQKCDCFAAKREEWRRQMTRYKGRPAGKQGIALAHLDLNKNLEVLGTMPMGGRNNYLSQVAGRTFLFDVLINNSLDQQVVWGSLVMAAKEAGLNEDEIRPTLASAFSWANSIYEGDTSG